MEEDECSACHEQVAEKHPVPGSKGFRPPAEGAELCAQCHDSMGGGKVVHSPVEEGECLACHKPHGSDGPYLLDVDYDQHGLCLECHEAEPFERDYQHGPAAMGACTECHDPHSSDQPALMKENVQNTCLGCHADFARGMKEASVIHSAVQEETCVSCHDPHGSEVLRLLKERMPDLCMECHDDIQEKYKRSRTKHAALHKDARCGNCHAIHFSDHEALLLKDEMPLCLGCHGHDDFSRSDALRNIRKEVEGKKYLHGPIEDGECTPCHDPHGSDFFRLLKGFYPGTFYAAYKPGVYAFCMECHDNMLLVNGDAAAETDFRNGSENLHFLHVAKAQKGRTCRACHEPHGSDWPKLISDKGAPFASWRIPVRFEKTETGGSCIPGCHREMRYDREKAVRNK